jgi:hypothetical protein
MSKKREQEIIENIIEQPDLENIPVYEEDYSGNIAVFKDMRGGWNTDKAPGNLADNELELADNVDYSKRWGGQKRKDVVNHLGSFAQQVERIFEWSTSDGTEELMAILADGSLVRTSDGSTIFQLFGTHISYFVLKEYLYIVDGNNYYRIDDTAFNYEAVVEKDTSSVEEDGDKFTAELDTAFNLKQDDLVTDSETVSLYSDPDTTFTKDTDYTMNYTDGKITPLSTGSMEAEENYYVEYEYNVESDNDLTPLRKCKYVIRHPKSYRIFAAGNPDDPSALYYSEYNEPDYFKGFSVLYPTTNDGTIQGLKVIDDMLLVFYPENIWVWRGIDPETDAVWEKLPVKHGIYNHRTLETTYNALTFVDNSGIYALDRQKGIQNITENKVSNEIKNISNKESICSVFDASNNRYMLAYSDTSGRNDKILTFDWELGAFARWTGLGDINDFCYTKDGKLLMATDNYIQKMNQDYGTNDINIHLKSRKMTLNNPYCYKLIKNLFLTLSNYTANTKATISIDDTDKIYTIASKITRNGLAKKGVEIQIDIQDNSDENVIVYNYGLEFKVVSTYRGEL